MEKDPWRCFSWMAWRFAWGEHAGAWNIRYRWTLPGQVFSTPVHYRRLIGKLWWRVEP